LGFNPLSTWRLPAGYTFFKKIWAMASPGMAVEKEANTFIAQMT